MASRDVPYANWHAFLNTDDGSIINAFYLKDEANSDAYVGKTETSFSFTNTHFLFAFRDKGEYGRLCKVRYSPDNVIEWCMYSSLSGYFVTVILDPG